jgi:hypothetical protein
VIDTQTLLYTVSAVAGLSFLGLIWVSLRLNRLDRIRKEFLPSDMGKNVEQVLVEQNRTITKLRSDLSDLNGHLTDLTIINKLNLNKIGFVRFNPFDDAGGNISFAVSLLNSHNDGVVISSLHGREGTRVYAKQIKAGESESKLTKEEIEAIKNAK